MSEMYITNYEHIVLKRSNDGLSSNKDKKMELNYDLQDFSGSNHTIYYIGMLSKPIKIDTLIYKFSASR